MASLVVTGRSIRGALRVVVADWQQRESTIKKMGHMSGHLLRACIASEACEQISSGVEKVEAGFE
ncbi:MAG: hypothetical protein AB7K64_01680 [Variibacter sp.]